MCLSTVISQKDGEEKELFSYVMSANVLDDEVVFTDILGEQKSFRCVIKDVDLVGNIIVVEEKE